MKFNIYQSIDVLLTVAGLMAITAALVAMVVTVLPAGMF